MRSRRRGAEAPVCPRGRGTCRQRKFPEVGGPHHIAHFHAYWQDEVAIISIDPIDVLAGSLPTRQRRLVEAWAELHQHELLDDWNRLQQGQRPMPIAPLA